ncbi:MAG: hypothetical protein K8R48_08425 [Alphaproteobacteria bacterium]|nr:hypothetical protein [Alphaproteobacteria bacterium]
MALMEKLTLQMIEDATGEYMYDLGNKTLYELCSKHPNHTDNQAIYAKVWLIGRAYAAAIERRRQTSDEAFEGEKFYTDNVVPKMRQSQIDAWFSRLKSISELNEQSLDVILNVHFELTGLFREISGLEKRSLASKYLHFHFPHLFFIFDTRAVAALRGISDEITRAVHADTKTDNEYRKFCGKCLRVCRDIEQKYSQKLTPRQLDNLLWNA